MMKTTMAMLIVGAMALRMAIALLITRCIYSDTAHDNTGIVLKRSNGEQKHKRNL